MSSQPIDRRRFLVQSAVGVGTLSAVAAASGDPNDNLDTKAKRKERQPAEPRSDYKGPNVILVRFGGGVRRRETVQFPDQTYCPFILHELAQKQGILFNNVEIQNQPGIDTSHGQGTLFLLTGQYRHYEDISHKPLSDRFVPAVPTIFEYVRERYNIPEHQALIINGEDRVSEEFYTFSNNHLFGINYRSVVLSLFNYKAYLLRKDLEDSSIPEPIRREKEKKLHEMESHDYRAHEAGKPILINEEIDQFWGKWKDYYGRSGFVNPRGDRLLTTLALWSLKQLRPRLMMINYQDPDYVHWGNAQFYTRAISIIDEGLREIYEAVQNDEQYRSNTIFVVVPDCGRDSNRGMAVPFQHHFNSKSSHEIFAVIAGPGIRDRVPNKQYVITKLQQQISVARTIGELMNFDASEAEAESFLKIV